MSGTTNRYRAYTKDANGSVTGVENDDGTIPDESRYDYDPYGELQQGESTLSESARENPFRFEGFYYDSGVKTYDMLARPYRPQDGRFLTQDRLASASADFDLQADPLTQNRYAFAGGNPVSRVEFDGHISPDQVVRNNETAASAQNNPSRGPIKPVSTYDKASDFRRSRAAERRTFPAGQSDAVSGEGYRSQRAAPRPPKKKTIWQIAGKTAAKVATSAWYAYNNAACENGSSGSCIAAGRGPIPPSQHVTPQDAVDAASMLPGPEFKLGETAGIQLCKRVCPAIVDRLPLVGRGARTAARGGAGTGAKGWKLGEDVWAPTRAGNDPTWSTVRSRYWKSAAARPDAAERYGAENVARMERGRAPQRYNPDKGGMESLELSHEPVPARRGGQRLSERWPCEHAAVDPYRNPGYC